MTALKTITSFSLVYGIWVSAKASADSPTAWAVIAFAVWALYVVQNGFSRLPVSEKHQLAWGYFSIAAFVTFLRRNPSFKGWQDVYFFCGHKMEFCNCQMEWNAAGWIKALILWNFALSTALALQKVVIQIGLKGLLPGEEMVTKESFISICWRLIPYCLNNWEKQWGAECSSMMFELPHFALELLVILPCVQILCSRLKIVAIPMGRGGRPVQLHYWPHRPGQGQGTASMTMAPSVMDGAWKPMLHQERIFSRLRANLSMLLAILAVMAAACFNALYVPLHLEAQIFKHPRAPQILAASKGCAASQACWEAMLQGQKLNPFGEASSLHAQCGDLDVMRQGFFKHGVEMGKMREALHTELLPLVEIALAALRMSCERFFLLLSIYAAYLVWHTNVPPYFRMLIRLNHRLSKIFQKVILYAFPAVCWIYGAGTVFSTFVSLIFWVGPAKRLYESIHHHVAVIQPLGLKEANSEQIETMGGKCSVCWGAMTAGGDLAPSQKSSAGTLVGQALSCGHAFHAGCIKRWLAQCHGQGRQPTCPLCNRSIKLQIKFRLPSFGPISTVEGPLVEPVEDEAAELMDFADRQEPGQAEPHQVAFPEPPFQPAFDLQGEHGRNARAAGESGTLPFPTATAFQGAPTGRLGSQEGPQSRPPNWRESPESSVAEGGWASDGRDRDAATQTGQDMERNSSLRRRPRTVRRRSISSAAAGTSDSLDPAGPSPPTDRLNPRTDPAERPEEGSRPGPSTFSRPEEHCRQVHSALSSRLYQKADADQSSGHGLEASSSSRAEHSDQSQLRDALCQAVLQDKDRAVEYLEFCKAQEAQLQAQIRLNKGVLDEAKQTALELLVNANMMARLVEPGMEAALEPVAEQRYRNRTSHGGGKEMCAELVMEMWQRQQQLWQKSKEFHGQQDESSHPQP